MDSISDLRQLETKELMEKIRIAKGTLGNMRINHAMEPLKNSATIRKQRKSIARAMTILNERRYTQA